MRRVFSIRPFCGQAVECQVQPFRRWNAVDQAMVPGPCHRHQVGLEVHHIRQPKNGLQNVPMDGTVRMALDGVMDDTVEPL